MAGTLINDIEIKTSSKVQDVQTTSHGGLFYLNGDDQRVVLDTMKAERVESTLGEGGLIFSSTSTSKLSVTISSSNLLSVKAKSLGSMISLRKGVTTPLLTLVISSS
jgi:hypothetical protein